MSFIETSCRFRFYNLLSLQYQSKRLYSIRDLLLFIQLIRFMTSGKLFANFLFTHWKYNNFPLSKIQSFVIKRLIIISRLLLSGTVLRFQPRQLLSCLLPQRGNYRCVETNCFEFDKDFKRLKLFDSHSRHENSFARRGAFTGSSHNN